MLKIRTASDVIIEVNIQNDLQKNLSKEVYDSVKVCLRMF